jgi:hypothetical protein
MDIAQHLIFLKTWCDIYRRLQDTYNRRIYEEYSTAINDSKSTDNKSAVPEEVLQYYMAHVSMLISLAHIHQFLQFYATQSHDADTSGLFGEMVHLSNTHIKEITGFATIGKWKPIYTSKPTLDTSPTSVVLNCVYRMVKMECDTDSEWAQFIAVPELQTLGRFLVSIGTFPRYYPYLILPIVDERIDSVVYDISDVSGVDTTHIEKSLSSV